MATKKHKSKIKKTKIDLEPTEIEVESTKPSEKPPKTSDEIEKTSEPGEDEKEKEETETKPKTSSPSESEESDKKSKTEKVDNQDNLETPQLLEPEKKPKKSDSKAEKEKKEKPDEDEKISSDEMKEWLSGVKPDTTKEVEKKARFSFKPILAILVFLLIIGVVVGGVFYYRSAVLAPGPTPTPTPEAPTSTQTEEKEATSSAETKDELDLSEYSLNILNGSGVAGEAAKVKALLADLDFKKTTTGNADSYDYTTTMVSFKEDTPNAMYDEIKKLLSNSYILEKADKALDEDSSYDVEVIVGSKKASD